MPRKRRPSRQWERRRRGAERPTEPGRPEPFPVDVEDRGDEFRVSASLPGLDKQDIDVGVRKNRVEVSAAFGDEEGDGRYRRQERPRGRARRVILLPGPVREARVSASYDRGVLRVTLPKLHRDEGE